MHGRNKWTKIKDLIPILSLIISIMTLVAIVWKVQILEEQLVLLRKAYEKYPAFNVKLSSPQLELIILKEENQTRIITAKQTAWLYSRGSIFRSELSIKNLGFQPLAITKIMVNSTPLCIYDVYFQDPPITVEPDKIHLHSIRLNLTSCKHDEITLFVCAETASGLQACDSHKILILG